MSTPFLRLIPRKIDEHIFRNADNLVLVALTQSLDQALTSETDEKVYKTTKINVFDFNGLKQANQELWDQVDARITDQTRRLQIILIEKDILNNLCPAQQIDPKSNTIDPNGNYDNLAKHGEISYAATLKDLSTMARRDLNKATGHKVYMHDVCEEKYEFQCDLQIMGNDEGLEFLKNMVWCDEKTEMEEINSLTRGGGHRNAKKQKFDRKKSYNKRNHNFKLTYFKVPVFCSVCQQFIWGIAEKQGYQCKNCDRTVHDQCINRCLDICKGTSQIYEVADGAPRVEADHDLTYKTNYKFRFDHKSGYPLMPFTKIYKCKSCNKCFKSDKNTISNCGVNEGQMYAALKDIQDAQTRKQSTARFSNQQSTENVQIYGALNTVRIDKKMREDGLLENIDGLTDQMKQKLNVSESDQLKMKDRKSRSRKIREETAASQSLKYSDFRIHKVLGQGSYGKVVLATFSKSKSKDKFVAIKAIRKDEVVEGFDVPATYVERDCLQFDCGFLIQAMATFQDPKYIYFCMDLYPGGDLMGYVMKMQKSGSGVKMQTAKIYAAEILLGLDYLHDKKIIYRDMKLDNVIIDSKGHCRICDFGMVKINCDASNKATTFCGTPDYMAPEILHKAPYDFKVDVWSWAICLFELIEGFSPFQGRTEDELFYAIKYVGPKWKYAKRLVVTNKMGLIEAQKMQKLKTLLENCFSKDPVVRPDVKTCLKSAYFSDLKFDSMLSGLSAPGDFVPSSGRERDILRNFDDDFTGLNISLDEPDIRALTVDEDKCFETFNWSNNEKVQYYKN